jgi:hypothetical protein
LSSTFLGLEQQLPIGQLRDAVDLGAGTFQGEAEHVAYKLLLHRHRKLDTYSIALDAATKAKLQHFVQQGRNLIAKEDIPIPKWEQQLGISPVR